MKPIIILPPDAISKEDIQLLRDNNLCVVVAADPSLVKFVDPIPAVACRNEMEMAAIKLSRKLLNGELVGNDYKKNVAALYVDILVRGTALDSNGTKQEQEQVYFDSVKRDELNRLAREEAKAERAKAKTNKSASV